MEATLIEKIWMVNQPLSAEQHRQLACANISVFIHTNQIPIELPLGRSVLVEGNTITRITTVRRSQETLIKLLFSDKIFLSEVTCSDDISWSANDIPPSEVARHNDNA